MFFRKNKSIDEWIEQYRNNKDGILIDVREKDEYRQEHIPEAKNIPLSEIVGGKTHGFNREDDSPTLSVVDVTLIYIYFTDIIYS